MFIRIWVRTCARVWERERESVCVCVCLCVCVWLCIWVCIYRWVRTCAYESGRVSFGHLPMSVIFCNILFIFNRILYSVSRGGELFSFYRPCFILCLFRQWRDSRTEILNRWKGTNGRILPPHTGFLCLSAPATSSLKRIERHESRWKSGVSSWCNG